MLYADAKYFRWNEVKKTTFKLKKKEKTYCYKLIFTLNL